MAGRTVQCTISSDLVATRQDNLFSDCLRIETNTKLILHPNTETRINLAVYNTSSEGRMGHIMANHDPRCISVKIPTSDVYIAPGGKTTVFAIISPIEKNGQTTVTFEIV